jgi:uncharacterized membrane protein/uncharacterized protein YrrD
MSSPAKFSSIPIGAKVICTDGSGGKSTALIVDPVSHSLTHIAVVEKSLLHGEERLVPVEKVVKTTRDTVQLNCTTKDILQMEPFTRTHYLEMDQGGENYAYSLPYMTMSTATMGTSGMAPDYNYITVQDRLVPAGEVAVHRGMIVEALDGSVGQVGELLIDPQTGKVTHFLLMKGHGWGKKEVAIQVSQIDRIEEETIHLKIEKEKISQLPSLPVKRTWDEVLATELELMVWVFEGKDLAQQTYQQVKALCTQYAIDLMNATVIEKSSKGDIKLHEVKKVPSKRRVALGIAIGGMAGLLVGPVALVAGIVAGRAAGKKSAKKIEVGFSEEKLRKLNESLAPGGSALVLLVEHRWFNTLQTELAENAGQLIHERLSNITFDELVGQLTDEKEEAHQG